MTRKLVRVWWGERIFIAVALLGSASLVSTTRERRLLSGFSARERSELVVGGGDSVGARRRDGTSEDAKSDDRITDDLYTDCDSPEPPCDSFAPDRVHENREGAASAPTLTCTWDEYVLRGNDLPQTERACSGARERKCLRFLTWKTTCVPSVTVAYIKSFLECMPGQICTMSSSPTGASSESWPHTWLVP